MQKKEPILIKMLVNNNYLVKKLFKLKSFTYFSQSSIKKHSSLLEGASGIRRLNNTIRTHRLGFVYLKCTRRNIFCTLIDRLSNTVITSCSLRVPVYKNEFNERENLYTRGLLLGKLFGDRIISLGYKKIVVYIEGASKGRSGVVRSFSKLGIDIYSIVLITGTAHNGCRPVKSRRKKLRTKVMNFK